MLASDNHAELHEFCEALHPAATADFMSGLTAQETWAVLRHADPALRTEIFHYFDRPRQLELVTEQDRNEVAQLLYEMATDDRVDLLNELEPALVESLLELLPKDERRDTLRLQSYPEGTAGAVMTTEVVKLAETLTVSEALDVLRQRSDDVETIYYLYIVDDGNHLRGVLSTRDLISSLATPNKPLRDIMDPRVISVDVLDDQEEVAQKVAFYDLLAIPVVDDQHQMLGIITHDDVIDVVLEEATEDAHRFAGVAPLETTYMEAALLRLFWSRGVWLAPLFFAAFLTANAIRFYEAELNQWTFLLYFLPMIMSSGGNSGNQSATLIITGLTTGDLTVKDWSRVVGREIVMGLLLGGMLAIFFVPVGYMFDIRSLQVVPATLVLVVTCGTLVGSVMPLVFSSLGQDPALMSNPFVAGVIDIVGILIYVHVAIFILR
ncbi:MAG: magnesium transporter [Planctomycetales bacterium]|nr:magnesium transporter [Planctomycetales bacterium]